MVISLPFKKTFEKETVGNFMRRVLKLKLKLNIIAEIFTRIKHTITKWFSSARCRFQ